MSKYDAIVAIFGIIFGTASVVGVAFAIAFGTSRWRRNTAVADGSMARLEQRLERMEQAIDAVAVEVERVSEGQRFATRLLSDQVGAKVQA